jgi:hypothetical protein
MHRDCCFPDSCPINERTGDGISVGRCWFHLDNGACPRHGDVSEAVKRYRASGLLTDENDLRPAAERGREGR